MGTFAYKFNILSWLLIISFECIWMVFMWTAVYKNSADTVINGFNFKQMISYVLITFIFSFTLGSSNTIDTICDEIRKGQIAMFLIKPISYRIRFTFSMLGSLFTANLIITIPFLTIIFIVLIVKGFIVISSVSVFIINILLFFVSQLLAALLLDAINYMCGIICFYTLAIFGLFQIKETIINFLSGGLIPLAFFPFWARNILNYSPFAGITQNPAFILLGRLSFSQAMFTILIQIIWIVALELINHLLFNHAIKKITIQGG